MKEMTMNLTTQSKYSSLGRKEKRTVEHNHDMMLAEQSLQKDLRSAERIARRIALVLDTLRKDVNCIKNHIGNYNFVNTVGADSTASGLCTEDLSTDIGTRNAWKQKLTNMISNSFHYVEAQKLGDYALLHSVSTSSDGCPVKYRSEFHYSTPRGDCLSFATSMGAAYTATTDAPTGDNDSKSSPGAYEHQSVQNCDLKFSETFQLLINEDSQAWTTELTTEFKKAVDSYNGESTTDWDGEAAYTTDAARKALIKTYLQNISCLPEALVDALLVFTDTTTFVISGVLITDIDAVALTAALAHVPSILNAEDESDIAYICKHFTTKMNTIRDCQLQNDREQQRMEFVRETSECNATFYKDAFQEMTEINESEIRAKRSVGKKYDESLAQLYKDNCFNKQTFFNDITLQGSE